MAGPNVVGTSQELDATLISKGGLPIGNQTVSFVITGANATTGVGTTDSSGVAKFTYTGASAGTDTAQATVTSGSLTLQSNTSTIGWVVPVQTISTTSVLGKFFAGGCGSFCHGPSDTPAFTQKFPTIDFNPPAGTVPNNITGVGVATRPFTDITTDVSGNFTGAVVAAGNGHQAGLGDLFTFDAVFTGNYVVAAAGDVTFNFYSDDGFIFGIGNGATRVGGADVNPPSSGMTPFQNYPIMGAFNVPTSPVANSVTVHFPAAGTYPYEVDYSECCGGEVAITMATAANGHGVPPAGNLALTPVNVPTQTIGQAVHLTVAAMDASGRPISNLPVLMNVGGINTQQVSGITDATGTAVLSYVGSSPGTDFVEVNANITGMPAISNLVSVPWAFGSGASSSQPPVAITDLKPEDGAVVTKPVPVRATFTPPQGQTIASWKVTYQAMDPGPEITLAQGNGTPPDPLATFDPTLLPNDTYAIHISATANLGGTQTTTTTVAVFGNLKLGRYVTTYQDLSVPVNGFQMQVRRTYDSIDKSVGDFGVGWHVSVSNFRTTSNRQLGAGGWTEYASRCFILCDYAFKTSVAHYVTVTFPDGHQEVFDFTPTGPSLTLFDFAQATTAFTARPGTATTSTLQDARGPVTLGYGFDGNLDDGNAPYNPTRFKLTLHNGTVLILDTATGLVSETDRNGNSVSVDSSGIHSSSGSSITFSRDAQNRITSITGPTGQTLRYTYDADGNLATSVDADGNVTTYSYTGDHLLASVTGPGQAKPFQQEVYDPNTGRLTEVIDGDGNVTTISDNVAGQQQTIIDPNGQLTTVDTTDDLGDILREDRIANGQTLTTTATYNADGRPLSRTDPTSRTWTGQYDSSGDLLNLTTPSGNGTGITYNSLGEPLTWTDPRGNTAHYTYDDNGNLLSITDPLGHTTTYAYDSIGNVIKRTNPLGNVWSYTYDSQGHPTSITDPLGRASHSTYDASGHLLSSTDAAGDTTTYTYDANGHLLTRTDPLGRTTTYTYNALGLLASKTDPVGKVTTYTYDGAERLISTADPLGHTTTNTYDADGRLATVTDPTGAVMTYTYDGFGRLASVTDPLGRITKYSYDKAGQLIGRTMRNAGTYMTTYGPDGNPVTQTDPLGNTTSTAYDANGNPLSITDPLGHTTTSAYDTAGELISTTDPLGKTTTNTYDADGRLVAVTNPLGQTTASGYDPAGQLISTTDATGRITTYGYDAAGRRVSVTDPAGDMTTSQYDASGQLTGTVQPSGSRRTNTYDADGHQLSFVDALGDATTYAYDAAGRETSMTDPLGHATTYGYDADGRSTLITDALGGTIHIGYDAAGQQLSTTNPRGDQTTFTYDPLGNVASETAPGNRVTTYAYDLDGRQTSRTDPRAVPVSNSYDAASELTRVTFPGGTTAYGYDADGRRTSMTDPTGTTTTGYDPAGRVRSVASSGGTLQYGYDAAGRRTSMTLSGSRTTQYVYDPAGRLSQLTDWTGGITQIGYTPDSLQAALTEPNGVAATYGYDAADRLRSIQAAHSGTPLASFTYTLDAAGNRVAMTSSGGAEEYSLDALNRLTNVKYGNGDVSSFSYDAAGNRTSETDNGTTTTYAYDSAGDLTKAGGTTYTYDAAGDRITAASSTFTWDWAGRLATANTGGVLSTYTYDGDGVRVRTQVGASSSSRLYDRQSSLPQLVDDGTNGYVQNPNANGNDLLAQLPHSGSAQYPIADALGSIRNLTNASGSISGSTSYAVFGGIRSQSGVTSVFGFTGQQTDPTGLSFLQARYYDPTTGSFLSPDTVQPNAAGTQGYDQFAYAANNPCTVADPSGHQGFIEFAVRTYLTVREFVFANTLRACLVGLLVGFTLDLVQQEVLTGGYQPGLSTVAFEAPAIVTCGLYAFKRLTSGTLLPTGGVSSESGGESPGGPGGPGTAPGGLAGTLSPYSGALIPVAAEDADAQLLANRIGGEASVRFANDPAGREFDAVSDEYIGQAKAASRTLGSDLRNQAKATFDAAQATGRSVYYHFDGEPDPSVVRQLREYESRYGVNLVIDTKPF
jgi:RHS repeat-associated protein